MFIKSTSPFKDFDPNHPLLSYALRSVPGGRTPEGLVRYSNKTLWILATLLFGGLAVLIGLAGATTVPKLDELLTLAVGYARVALFISILIFPIVDFVTVFYAVNAVRGDRNTDGKFDLMRITTIKPDIYAITRLTLARVQAWRVFVVMWYLRLLCCVLVTILAIVAALLQFISQLTYPLHIDVYVLAVAVVYNTLVVVGVAYAMMIYEPLWRFKYLSSLGALCAARHRNIGVVWLRLVSTILITGIITLGFLGILSTLLISLQPTLLCTLIPASVWVLFQNALGEKHELELPALILRPPPTDA